MPTQTARDTSNAGGLGLLPDTNGAAAAREKQTLSARHCMRDISGWLSLAGRSAGDGSHRLPASNRAGTRVALPRLSRPGPAYAPTLAPSRGRRVRRAALDRRVDAVGGDATHVIGVPGHLEEAGLAPAGAPRVLDDPVVSVGLGAVADGQHAVVQLVDLRAAVGVGVDAARVELEVVVGRVHADSDGADVADGVQKIGLVLGLDDDEVGAAGHHLGGVVVAPVVVGLGLIRVVGLGHASLDVGEVLERIPHLTTVAGVVVVVEGAVHELLLGERHQVVAGQLPHALEGAGGGEGTSRSRTSPGPWQRSRRHHHASRGCPGRADRSPGTACHGSADGPPPAYVWQRQRQRGQVRQVKIRSNRCRGVRSTGQGLRRNYAECTRARGWAATCAMLPALSG